MIRTPPFLQDFEQTMKISATVAKQNKYSQITNHNYIPSKQQAGTVSQTAKQSEGSPSLNINLSFTPRSVEGNFRKIGKKYQQLLKQMQDTEIQKKLKLRRNSKKQHSYSEDRDQVAAFVNQKIQEYNNIVDHNHLKTNITQTKAINQSVNRNINTKISNNKTDQLMTLIKKQQKQLQQSTNIDQKHFINQKISKNYHRISSSLLKSHRQKQCPSANKSSLSQSLRTSDIDLSSMRNSKQNEKQRNSKMLLKKQSRYSHIEQPQNLLSQLNFSLKQPYIRQQQLQKSHDFERDLQLNQDKIESWRNRLSESSIYPKGHQFYRRKNSSWISNSNNNTSHLQKVKDQISNPSILLNAKMSMDLSKIQTGISQFPQLSQQMQYSEQDCLYDNKAAQKTEKLKNDRNKYLSQYLSKHNPKFMKVKGNNNNKIMLRFDSVSIARSMLQGEPQRESRQERMQRQKVVIPKYEYKSMHRRRFHKPNNLSQEQSSIVQHMLQQEGDIYYWTTCRNEQINLLLKGGRKNSRKTNNKS